MGNEDFQNQHIYEKIFLSALSEVLHDDADTDSPAATAILNTASPDSTIRTLLSLAKEQKIVPLIYDFLCTRELEIPKEQVPALKYEVTSYAIAYYQNQYFSDFVCQLFDEAELPYALMKGVLLSRLYKKPECRRFSDVDILINDRQAFKRASALLAEHGFTCETGNSDHHQEYYLEKNGREYLLELHYNPISSQTSKKLNKKIHMLYHSVTLHKKLPATLDAVYLLLHMLQHILNAGFGIKLLCDWVLFLEANTKDIDSEQLKNILDDLEIFSFSLNITIYCMEYLGLTTYPECFHHDALTPEKKHSLELLSEDIFSGGEYGKNNSARMIIMKGHFHLIDYFLELHRQTKKNFPILWKTILLLPVLWILTGLKFLYNNNRIRHTDTKTILETTKKRQQLLDAFDINF